MIRFYLITVFCLLNVSLAFSKNKSVKNKNFEEIINKYKINKNSLGILIKSDTKTYFSLNENKLFIPASITKIATSLSVLRNIPQGYRFKTQLLSEAKIADSTLKGSLFLKGGGDPSFVSENMWFLVNAFTRNEIKKIEGDIIVDDSLFDNLRFDPSRQKERVDRAYDAPVGAMSFNWNSVNIFVKPTQKGQPAKITIDPENDVVEVTGKIMTGTKTEMSADRVDKDGKFIIRIQGTISENENEKPIFVNISEPDIWSGENLKQFLKQRGIEIKGKIKSGKTPSSAKVLAESEGPAIEKILADMNKFSNNYVAEMLTKNLQALKTSPATLASGMKIIEQDLQAIGLKTTDFEIENPSGLTRKNKFSAQAMWKVLDSIQNDFRIMPEFMVSLPISGIDGTLKKRMTKSNAKGFVRAKTGFLTGVVSLAGYVIDSSDQRIVPFVFIFNGSEDEAKVRQMFDELCEEILN